MYSNFKLSLKFCKFYIPNSDLPYIIIKKIINIFNKSLNQQPPFQHILNLIQNTICNANGTPNEPYLYIVLHPKRRVFFKIKVRHFHTINNSSWTTRNGHSFIQCKAYIKVWSYKKGTNILHK